MADPIELEELLQKYVSKNRQEVDLMETYSELFAIIKTTEKLERAYIRDKAHPKEYEEACQRLITQFKTLHDAVRTTVPDLNKFMEAYSLSCPRAANRLIRSGMPATLEHGQLQSEDSSTRQAARDVSDCTEALIGLMDVLKLDMKAVDSVHPYVTQTVVALNKIQVAVPNLTGRDKLKEWASKLHQMKASDDLSPDDVRQLLFDTGNAYEEFKAKI